jgi:hypothetical protein
VHVMFDSSFDRFRFKAVTSNLRGLVEVTLTKFSMVVSHRPLRS